MSIPKLELLPDNPDEILHTFINEAAGLGLILDGVDAGDLYVRLFPNRYAATTASIYTGTEE